jgi:hypothetical protein
MLFRSFVAGAALALLATAPASAAPVLTMPLKPCYVAASAEDAQREPVIVRAAGFSRLAMVDIYVDDILQTSAQASYAGTLDGSVRAPSIETGQRVFSLRLTERDAPINTVSATALVTRLSVEQLPAQARTSQRVRFRGRGFTSLAPVYAHYVFAGKSRRTVLIGTPQAPCGTFSVRRRQFPFKKSPRRGVWTIWFDQEQRYTPKAAVRVPLKVRVKSRIKPRRARAR